MADMSQYEYMLAVTPDEAPEEKPDDSFSAAASMLREALRLIAEVLEDDADDGAILAWRFAGLSMAEIGGRLGMTKQAVHKRIRNIAQRWPSLGKAISGATAPLDERIVGKVSIVENYQKLEKIRQEATRWMNKPN